ncbi:unnamed protein product, partial [Amoebophrya sp. A120]|eukprot:GSA120T00005227001.1
MFVAWQAGSRDLPDAPVTRDAGHILADPVFVEDFCKTLMDILAGCAKNWSAQNILQSIIYLAQAIFERTCNGTSKTAVAHVLREARKVVVDWIGAITNLLNGCDSDDAMQNFRNKLVAVSTMGALTFSADKLLLNSSEDVADWLYFRATAKDNTSPHWLKSGKQERNAVLHAMKVAEEVFARFVKLTDAVRILGLTIFFQRYYRPGNLAAWQKAKDAPWWFSARFSSTGAKSSSCCLQIDVIS